MASFYNPKKFGLIRKAVMLIPDLAQFAIYRGASTYEELRKAIKEFNINVSSYLTDRRLLQKWNYATQSVCTGENIIDKKSRNTPKNWPIFH